ADLQALLTSAEYPALEAFFSRTVEAAEDAEDCILRAGARLNLPLQQVSDAIASQGYNLAEPPMGPSPWVDELCLQLAHFRDRLAQVRSLSDRNQRQLWRHAIALVGEVVLDSIARVRSRCSAIGRNAMAMDLSEAGHGLRNVCPHEDELRIAVDVSTRFVDNYIKAFFIQTDEELERWVQTNPQYSKEQHMQLGSAIADFRGLKRKDKALLLSRLEASML
ncbi:hypothetical protein WJX84_011037, partial [Apatococcus fuscideae]